MKENKIYKGKKVKMPKPELYVGKYKNILDKISLSKEFFGGADIAIDVKVKVISESDTDSIINYYIIFSKVYDEEEVMRFLVKSERYDEAKDNARRLLKLGKIKVDEIAECFSGLSKNDVRELETGGVQLA